MAPNDDRKPRAASSQAVVDCGDALDFFYEYFAAINQASSDRTISLQIVIKAAEFGRDWLRARLFSSRSPKKRPKWL